MLLTLLSHPYVHAALIGFAAAFAALLPFGLLSRAVAGRTSRATRDGRLVFEGRSLIGGEGPVKRAFDASIADGDDWDRAVDVLKADFPSLAEARLPIAIDTDLIESTDGRRRAVIARENGMVTLSFDRPGTRRGGRAAAAPAESSESGILDTVAEAVPVPIWIRDRSGSVIWVNRAYLDIASGADPDSAGPSWPPPDLFEPGDLPDPELGERRARLPLGRTDQGRPRVYDVHAERCGDRTVFTATEADAILRAEARLEDFTRTLTKTFAHLTIGLAIFDQARRLILFNPALTDLTGLPFDFLASKPTLVGVLDRLRERRIVPEPKDYISWRSKMAELEAAAVDGSYQETWTLPTGQTYRVTGRPHPDGAVIFLFEDISAEISLTRRYRAELEMGQAVIDSLDEAISVFTADGVLVMANAAYAALWGSDPNTELSGLSVNDITAAWHRKTAPTPIWGDFRDFARQGQNRVEWTSDAIMEDGRLLHCRFVPLAGGATLAAFRPRRAGDLRLGAPQRQSA